MGAYRVAHAPGENPPNEFLLLAHNHGAIYELATRLGLRVSIDHLDGHDDILWFSYTRGGVVQTKQVPIASRLERFAKALGITEKARWHDAWVAAVQVCGNLPRPHHFVLIPCC
jgi:hemolysin activation/secretion protein